MRIEELIPQQCSGMTAVHLMERLPDVPVIEILDALRIACREGKLERIGAYYWRKH